MVHRHPSAGLLGVIAVFSWLLEALFAFILQVGTNFSDAEDMSSQYGHPEMDTSVTEEQSNVLCCSALEPVHEKFPY